MTRQLSAWKACSIFVVTLSLLVVYLLYQYNSGIYHYIIDRTIVVHRPEAKVILLWTPFFGIRDYMPVGEGALSHSGCPESRCEVTTDRNRLDESQAVVFHCRDVNVVDLPVFRRSEQRWIYYCLESPHHSYFSAFRFMKRMFNWTMSYRLDSDVVTSYGSYDKLEGNDPAGDEKNVQLLELWRGKNKSAVWLVSNCPTPGNREGFVDDLQRYVDVDVFGTCGKERCPDDKLHECLNAYVKKYMFFLALENSICKDYVTEKFFRILNYYIVPVVFGGADYARVAPPRSYIDALSFNDTRQLARHLRAVASNYSLYKSYFNWRERYRVPPPIPLICQLCEKLHSPDVAPNSVYEDIAAWWVEDSRCKKWNSSQINTGTRAKH